MDDTAALDRERAVAPLDGLRSAEYFAVAAKPIPDSVVEELARQKGVESVETVDAARVMVDDRATSVLGVDPSTFRNYAPKPSAVEDDIWQGILEGHLALSHEMGEERGLDVGGDVTLEGAHGRVVRRVWTHATSGIAGIDVVAPRQVARALGVPEGNGLIVSAPEADLWELRDRLVETLGEDVELQLLAEDPGPSPGPEGEAVSGGTVEEMIAAAESKLGAPYVWGGDGPEVFDCSGLVQWAFRQAGISVPRVTHNQWNAGERVDFANARRGDLIFWRSDPTAPDYISHVAVYLGDGKMIEAPRSGDVVKVTDVRFENMAGVVRVHTSP